MYKYFVSSNQRITPTTQLLTLRKDSASKSFSFKPGQYAAISFKHHHRPTPVRCFSIVSSPTNKDVLQFSMRTKGRFTRALAELSEGDEVTVSGAFGGFVFDILRDTDTVLLAGGIGITPYMSMLEYAAAANLSNKITLVFSCQNQDDVPFMEQLKNLEMRNPYFKAIYAIGDGSTDKLAGRNVATGRITPSIVDNAVAGTYNKSFFVCGPPAFMHAMTKVLEDKGVPADRIMTEAFSQGPNRQTGKIKSWPFNMYALGAVGVALGSFVVMVSDLMNILPPSSFLGSSLINSSTLTNDRQADLDRLVNALPTVANTSPATTAANTAAQQPKTNNPAAPTPAPSGKSTSPSTPTVVKPYVAPTPKCTTTQSGVMTCV